MWSQNLVQKVTKVNFEKTMFPINFIFSLEAKFRKLNIYPMAQKYKRHIIC